MPTIRLPAERLADCCWLPRIIDKTRSFLAGELPFTYRLAFGSPIGVDGYFLRHFRISRGGFIRAVRAAGNDEDVGKWFLAQPNVNSDQIARWNRDAPQLGAKGQAGRAVFLAVRWLLYPRDFRSPSKNMFAAIEQDES
jgi:hypothetical protein